MAEIHSIETFPVDIDRDYFGAWLSGFVDGEGSFGFSQFYHGKQRYFISRADFFLGLRADDAAIIELIRSYWQCGSIHYRKKQRTNPVNGKPTVDFRIHRAADLMNVLLPHFAKFPLLAKKKRDFEIWKEGVILQYNIKSRGKKGLPGHHGGTLPKWTKEETEHFTKLTQSLRETRKYDSKNIPIPTPKETDEEYRYLF